MIKKFLIVFLLLFSSSLLFAAENNNPIIEKKYHAGYRYKDHGWVVIHIEGAPFERGEQYGYLVAPELKQFLTTTKYITFLNYGKTWDFFVDATVKLFAKKITPEYLAEMRGIAKGAQLAGTNITWEEILTLNAHDEIMSYWWPTISHEELSLAKLHCTAFIATGSATKDGKIVMAHNTYDDFVNGQFENIVLNIKFPYGKQITMQTMPGYIYSNADFFITSDGLMGTETTIGGFNVYNPHGTPEFVRARLAMQYAKSLDDFTKIMAQNNTGGYANSWLLGDYRTNEIMLFEAGLNYQRIEKKKDGYFIGYNSASDPRIRNLETNDTEYRDIKTSSGARQVRLTQLMQQYYGKIDIAIAETILADHYDVYLQKNVPSSRSIDAHFELDAQQYSAALPFTPYGALDGKVTDSNLAKNLSFYARWGSSSGMPFNAKEFLQKNPQWNDLKDYLQDRPSQPWTLISN